MASVPFEISFNIGHGYDYRPCDPSTMASMLKMWIRDLPDPLIPHAIYEDLLAAQAIQDPEGKMDAFKNLISLIPESNRSVLSYFASFLNEVAANSSKNKMTLQALSTIFGPNVIRSKVDTFESVAKIPHTNAALQYILEFHVQLLG